MSFVFVCSISINAPWSWSWGWHPHWGSAQEHWPLGSCWARWATGSSPFAASASWTWRGFAQPALRPPVTRPTRWRESPRHSSSGASRGRWGSCRSSPFCSPDAHTRTHKNHYSERTIPFPCLLRHPFTNDNVKHKRNNISNTTWVNGHS